jgi:hypothetical protein
MARRRAASAPIVHEHNCEDPENFLAGKFLQHGSGLGADVLVAGESLAPGGWRKSGRAFACYCGQDE